MIKFLKWIDITQDSGKVAVYRGYIQGGIPGNKRRTVFMHL